jgi:hypothetical protein
MLNPKTIDELLEQACPSICYRLRLEVLNEPGSARHMRLLQRQILDDEAVREVFGWQQPDGWLAYSFHGYPGTETGIRLLCEKGVDRSHPLLARALLALRRETARLERGLGKVGGILDELQMGGAQTIRATVLAYAGIEDEPSVQEQLDLALVTFKTVLSLNSPGELYETYKGKRVYRREIVWPSIYHLRLLAFTHTWRNAENQRIITEGIRRLVAFSPLPGLLVRYKSQLIAPASFCMHDFKPELASLEDAHWMMWFHRMEMLSRLGVIHSIPELEHQVNDLEELLDAGQGKFTKPMAHDYFRRWGAYTGLMLEKDWKISQRRIYDLTFRSLLILHFCEKGPGHDPGAGSQFLLDER